VSDDLPRQERRNEDALLPDLLNLSVAEPVPHVISNTSLWGLVTACAGP
jgi:hypothetical protein